MKHRTWLVLCMLMVLLSSGIMVVAVAAADANYPDERPSTLTEIVGVLGMPEGDRHIAVHTAMSYTTVITINTTEDTSGETQTKTCYFTQSVFSAASDGKCNLRRALVEASHRPATDRPILIKFDLPLTDTHYYSDTQTWTIVMDADYSSSASGEAIVVGDIDNPSNPDSYITIDGNT